MHCVATFSLFSIFPCSGDINECANEDNDCDAGYTCHNTVGSFKCGKSNLTLCGVFISPN